ncbi:MAG: hypothetical protein HWN68_12755 [Desulfobacterales bacterium]|nr:hypothetical protein [Desulfobacterales bacterium]
MIRVTIMGPMLINPRLESYELSRLFGGGGRQSFSRSLRTKLETRERTLSTLLEPRLHYRVKKIDKISNGFVSLEGGITFRSTRLSQALKDSDKIVCFVATVGSGIEREIVRLTADNRLSEAYILDAMGSVAVENIVEQFCQRKEAKFALENKSVTLRFSPGYCDWPITDQKKLFELFGSESTGVGLLDSCLMQPRKSISGVFGLFHHIPPHASPPYNPCHNCKKTDCIARRNQE